MTSNSMKLLIKYLPYEDEKQLIVETIEERSLIEAFGDSCWTYLLM